VVLFNEMQFVSASNQMNTGAISPTTKVVVCDI